MTSFCSLLCILLFELFLFINFSSATNALGDEQTIINGNVALSPPFTSNRRPVTQDEKNNALLMAQAVSTTDSFTVVMRPTHVYKRFYMVSISFSILFYLL